MIEKRLFCILCIVYVCTTIFLNLYKNVMNLNKHTVNTTIIVVQHILTIDNYSVIHRYCFTNYRKSKKYLEISTLM